MQNIPDISKIIIDAAQNIFSRFGYKKTTMDDIARAINKGKSSLYYYFKSKEEVFKAVVEKESLCLKEELNRAISAEENSKKKLHAYFITRTRVIKNLVNFHEVLTDEYMEYYSFVEKIREKYFAEEHKIINKILKDGRVKKEFIIIDLDLTTKAIIKALKGFEYIWAIEKDFSVVEKDIYNLLEILFYGLVKR